jgi:hypothetical protein
MIRRSGYQPGPRRPTGPLALALALAFGTFACGGDADIPAGDTSADDAPTAAALHPHDAFLENLASLCGRAFRGEAELATSSDFDGEMIMHVRVCTDDEVQIPLHIDENRSRTWIVTRTADGLRLKHDHRQPDGSEDEQTQYGGDTVDDGTPLHQSFPADDYTAVLIPEAVTNVWSMTLEPGVRLTYHLTRHDAPRATFVFDLTDEVEPPPAPWGYEGT